VALFYALPKHGGETLPGSKATLHPVNLWDGFGTPLLHNLRRGRVRGGRTNRMTLLHCGAETFLLQPASGVLVSFEMSSAIQRIPKHNGSVDSLAPPLKWAGGKRWQLPYLREIWQHESSRRLVEPFCGGLAVALGLMPQKALLNDVNPHLVNFYEWLKRGFRVSIEMENDKTCFYDHRSRFNQLLNKGKQSTKEAASLFYYLNRTGYNGLCRFNRSGEFNVPFGRYKAINYRVDFREYRLPLSKWNFTNVSFPDLSLEPEDFVYADPPYDVEFTHYSKGGFGWDLQVKTAEWLRTHPGPVALSNQATDRIVDLYKKLGYRLVYLKAPRRISCTGDRTPAAEVLALRNLR
jgi:DNA adenine methylase